MPSGAIDANLGPGPTDQLGLPGPPSLCRTKAGAAWRTAPESAYGMGARVRVDWYAAARVVGTGGRAWEGGRASITGDKLTAKDDEG
jgi:hypothetical protein